MSGYDARDGVAEVRLAEDFKLNLKKTLLDYFSNDIEQNQYDQIAGRVAESGARWLAFVSSDLQKFEKALATIHELIQGSINDEKKADQFFHSFLENVVQWNFVNDSGRDEFGEPLDLSEIEEGVDMDLDPHLLSVSEGLEVISKFHAGEISADQLVETMTEVWTTVVLPQTGGQKQFLEESMYTLRKYLGRVAVKSDSTSMQLYEQILRKLIDTIYSPTIEEVLH